MKTTERIISRDFFIGRPRSSVDFLFGRCSLPIFFWLSSPFNEVSFLFPFRPPFCFASVASAILFFLSFGGFFFSIFIKRNETEKRVSFFFVSPTFSFVCVCVCVCVCVQVLPVVTHTATEAKQKKSEHGKNRRPQNENETSKTQETANPRFAPSVSVRASVRPCVRVCDVTRLRPIWLESFFPYFLFFQSPPPLMTSSCSQGGLPSFTGFCDLLLFAFFFVCWQFCCCRKFLPSRYTPYTPYTHTRGIRCNGALTTLAPPTFVHQTR